MGTLSTGMMHLQTAPLFAYVVVLPVPPRLSTRVNYKMIIRTKYEKGEEMWGGGNGATVQRLVDDMTNEAY